MVVLKFGFISIGKLVLFPTPPKVIVFPFNITKVDPSRYHITYHLFNENGDPLFSFSHNEIELKENENKLQFSFAPLFFQSGTYYLHFFLVEDRTRPVLIEKDIFSFNVIDGARELGVFLGREPGFIRPNIKSKLL